jgi:hypothetical protein
VGVPLDSGVDDKGRGKGGSDDKHFGDEDGKRRGFKDEGDTEADGLELEKLVAKEVQQWRSEVDRSRGTQLRYRKKGGDGPGAKVENAMEEVRSLTFRLGRW